MNTETKAKATMHITVIRKDGRTEEFDVPVSTDMTREQVRALIAGVRGSCGEPTDIEASAGTAGTAAFRHVCPKHLHVMRESAFAAGETITAKRAFSSGLCTAVEG